MEWDKLLPIVNSVVGGTVLLIVLYMIITNKLALPREVAREHELYLSEKHDKEELKGQSDQMVVELRRANDTLTETARSLQNANNMLTGLLQKQGVVQP